MQQQPLFRLTHEELATKAHALVELRRKLTELGDELKEAQQALRDSDEAADVRRIKEGVKATREAADFLLRELHEVAL